MVDIMDSVVQPTEPGWYASAADGLSDYLIFLRLPDIDSPDVIKRSDAWMAFTKDGNVTHCDWDYIAQAGPVTRLIKQEGAYV